MFLFCAILSLVCWIVVQVALFRSNPKLAVFGLLSFGAFTWLWGWLFWRSPLKVPVMTAWTAATVACFVFKI
ncbi:MAG: hypothetical protein ACYCW6_02930 [Candidatus Xenobia bacterium]